MSRRCIIHTVYCMTATSRNVIEEGNAGSAGWIICEIIFEEGMIGIFRRYAEVEGRRGDSLLKSSALTTYDSRISWCFFLFGVNLEYKVLTFCVLFIDKHAYRSTLMSRVIPKISSMRRFRL
jgi:hypothetical protein